MDLPTDKQKRDFWEWCGWRWIKERHYVYGYMMHGGSWHEGYWKSPLKDDNQRSRLPDIDLNNLFEYAVQEDWEFHFYFDKVSQSHDCIVTLPSEKEYDGSGDSRVDALYGALDKVRKVEL